MNRGEIWIAEVGSKTRPVLVLTRQEVIDVRTLVTVAEVTTQIRGLAAEVELNHLQIGLAV
jgi:mRNA-degrading endonuclease toxin of MazEF toxin-antitoxin module